MNRTEETEILREALAASVGDIARQPLAERLQWLSAVQASLNAADDESHVLDIARDAAWRLGQAHGITVALRDHGSCRLLPTAGGDLPCPELDAICAEAAQHGRCLMINLHDSDAPHLPDPLRSLLLVPAGRAGSRTIGVCWYRPCPVDEDNRVLLEMLCRTTAAALDQLDVETRSRMNDQRFRVLVEGETSAGDAIEVLHRPAHGVTIGDAFRGLSADQSRALLDWALESETVLYDTLVDSAQNVLRRADQGADFPDRLRSTGRGLGLGMGL